MDYGYLLDDDAHPLPDPRSRRLPNGVHALSRTYDPASYAWQDASWQGKELRGSVIYELHVGTFTPAGTLDAAADKLGYLADLGIDFVELLPVNGFNGTHNWATTAFSGSRSTKATADPRPTSVLWTPPTPPVWALSRMWCTTTWDPAATTCPDSARTSSRATPTPGRFGQPRRPGVRRRA
ncbi:malto-oligosyltrehalose trehalohydrolase [Arthrobacter sp. Hiyo4]|nr:malto-oligosyltrehalose trehalohydrolase [Arthrobacter sp. Hiyo4]